MILRDPCKSIVKIQAYRLKDHWVKYTAEGMQMEITVLCEMQLKYTLLEYIDYGVGGQYVGTMEGTVTGEKLNGKVYLVNAPPKRPDNVNLPRLRGLITTDDKARIYVEMDGIALLRPEDQARVFTTSVTMRSGDDSYKWVNNVFGVMEGVLDAKLVNSRALIYEVKNNIEA